ncbi:MAG: GNAT family N-acetyltransferase [Methylotenera sp.]|nr:GNAT family N-acetyltransferase [Oligoflexia bacterium]
MSNSSFELRNTRLEDIDPIIDLCAAVYPGMYSWGPNQLTSHLEVFPEGQFVVVQKVPSPASGLVTDRVIGMASSLIVDYSNHDLRSKWKDITEWGYLGNHAPERGRTLYGVEIMVHPEFQGKGVGKLLYQRRELLARERRMLNIRAGARISGYHRYAQKMSAREYVVAVIRGEFSDPTLSFQLKRGFRVIGLTPYYFHDPESLNHAAVIEWLNPEVATEADHASGDLEFLDAAKAAALPLRPRSPE